MSSTHWDPVHLNYPVRKFPETGITSETIGRHWRTPPDVLHELKTPVKEARNYCRDYNVTSNLSRSQTAVDFGYKIPETERFNKHTSCDENLYMYPPCRKLADRTPAHTAHGISEMKRSYTTPTLAARLVTDKDQQKHPASLPVPPSIYTFNNEIELLDTTHEGFEKYLDPYLTTNRLHHRPFTADQLRRPSNSKDVITFYTYANIPWVAGHRSSPWISIGRGLGSLPSRLKGRHYVFHHMNAIPTAWDPKVPQFVWPFMQVRSPKPNCQEFRLPLSKAKSIYDREKFKQGFREIITHNKVNWVPRSFKTEVRDNYVKQTSRPESQIHNFEEEVRSHYERSIASLQTSLQQQHSSIRNFYKTENAQIGSRKPLCSVLDQFVENNKRLKC